MHYHSGSNIIAQLHEFGFVHAEPHTNGWCAYLNPALKVRLWIPVGPKMPLWLGVPGRLALDALLPNSTRVLPGVVTSNGYVLTQTATAATSPEITEQFNASNLDNPSARENAYRIAPVPDPDVHVFQTATFQEFVDLLQTVTTALTTNAQSPASKQNTSNPTHAPDPNPEIDKATLILLGDDSELSSTELLTLAIARRGQDVFRQKLVDYWQGACALTGITDAALLRASHIRPWAQCETAAQRLDVHNGILLAAHLDAAFDQGLLTFDESGCCVLSPQLSVAGRGLFSAWAGVRIAGITPAHQVYLRWHRARVFLA